MLHEALRLLRVFHELTQAELGSELSISTSYLSELEKGKKQPSLDILSKYSDVFGIPMSSLMLFSEELDTGRPSDRLRVGAAKKVLSMLNWVAEKSGYENSRGKVRQAA